MKTTCEMNVILLPWDSNSYNTKHIYYMYLDSVLWYDNGEWVFLIKEWYPTLSEQI